jgi:hypothetical protein
VTLILVYTYTRARVTVDMQAPVTCVTVPLCVPPGRDLKAAIPSLRTTQPRDGDNRSRSYEGVGLKDTQ